MKCPKCGSSRLVDNGNGKKCVNCDFEWTPRKTGCGTWLVLIIIGVFVIPYFIGKNSYENYVEQAQQKAEQERANNVQRIVSEAESNSNVIQSNTQNKTENKNSPSSSNNTRENEQNKGSQEQQKTSNNVQSKSESILTAFGNWGINADDDEFNGNKNVYFYNKSLDSFTGDFNLKHTPVMTVRCKDNKTEVIINFDVVMSCMSNKKIGLKFDNEKPYFESWSPSTDCKAMFASNPVKLLKKMADKKKLIVKFTPFQRGDINVSFNLTGIDKVKDKIAGVCHWRK